MIAENFFKVFSIFCKALCGSVPSRQEQENFKQSLNFSGTLGTMFQLFLTIGILFDYTLDIFKSYNILCYSCMGVNIAFLIFAMFIPETPTYCMKKNRRTEAESSLRRLRGPYYDVQGELNELRKKLEAGAQETFSLRLLLRKANAKALIISVGIMVLNSIPKLSIAHFCLRIFKKCWREPITHFCLRIFKKCWRQPITTINLKYLVAHQWNWFCLHIWLL